ncbi:HipA family kinase [Vibrio harveyi]|uniref:HipA family kinase n=1 Tax=Vibrio harveyi TaxID=669 RepID=UPI003D723099
MISINTISKEMTQGQTGPYLCADEDDNEYIVKGPRTTYRGLVNELVCATLGKALGLPIPDFEIAYVDRTLLRYGSYSLDEGDWFASKFEPNVQDLVYSAVGNLDPETLKLLFIFDYWIKNNDRTLTEKGGNPNVFIKPDGNSIIVLDHNLAFCPTFDEEWEEKKMLHVGASAWFQEQLSLYDREFFTEKMGQAISTLDEIEIPEEWSDNCAIDSIMEDIRLTLSRYETEEFWEGIK